MSLNLWEEVLAVLGVLLEAVVGMCGFVRS